MSLYVEMLYCIFQLKKAHHDLLSAEEKDQFIDLLDIAVTSGNDTLDDAVLN